MAVRLSGFTRASSLGPITEFMDRQGGSVARILREVGLPFALLEKPEILVPLRAQFRFLERAARETGDDWFGAHLGQVVKMKELSAFGAWVCAAETLQQAVARGHAGLNNMLQSATVLTLERRDKILRWSIEFVEPETDGRHQNEFLGLSYVIDTIRTFAGDRWRPNRIMTALPAGTRRAELELIFGTNISHGHMVPAIEFDAELLNCARRRSRNASTKSGHDEPPVPGQDDLLAIVAAVTELAVHDGYPRIEWVASKLGMTRRSLQRRLHDQGTSFNCIVEETLFRHAKALLTERIQPITDIALALGYSDPAHFTRAFRRWAGVAPTTYRAAAN